MKGAELFAKGFMAVIKYLYITNKLSINQYILLLRTIRYEQLLGKNR